MTADFEQNLKKMFRSWGRTDSEAIEFYRRVENEASSLPPGDREKYIRKRIDDYTNDLV